MKDPSPSRGFCSSFGVKWWWPGEGGGESWGDFETSHPGCCRLRRLPSAKLLGYLITYEKLSVHIYIPYQKIKSTVACKAPLSEKVKEYTYVLTG